MKKLISIAILLTIVVALPVVVLANGDEAKKASVYCKAHGNLEFKNHGQCVSFLMSSDGPFQICKELLDTDPAGFFDMYSNMAECVGHLADGYPQE